MTAPCLLPLAIRAPVARCAGWLQAQATGRSSPLTPHPRGKRAPPHAPLLQGAPARRPRVPGAAPAQPLALSRSPPPASEAPCAGVRFPLATVRDAIHRRAFLRMPVQSGFPWTRHRATLPPRCARVQTAPDALPAKAPCLHHALRSDTRPRRVLLTLVTLPPPRAVGVAHRHAQSVAQRAYSGRELHFRPPLRAQGYGRGARRARPDLAQRGPSWSGAGASRSPPPLARERPSMRGEKEPDQAWPAFSRLRRGARLRVSTEPRDNEHARRSAGRRAVRALTAPHPGPSRARPGRARPAQSRTRRQHTWPEPQPLSGRRRARRFVKEPWLGRDRQAAPLQCHEALALARRRARRLDSERRWDHPPQVRALRTRSVGPFESRHTCHSHR